MSSLQCIVMVADRTIKQQTANHISLTYAVGVSQPLSISVFHNGSLNSDEDELLQIVQKNVPETSMKDTVMKSSSGALLRPHLRSEGVTSSLGEGSLAPHPHTLHPSIHLLPHSQLCGASSISSKHVGFKLKLFTHKPTLSNLQLAASPLVNAKTQKKWILTRAEDCTESSFWPDSCTPAQCEGQGTGRLAAGDVTPGQAMAAMHKIASTDHRPPPICCDARSGGCRRRVECVGLGGVV
ncbi:S-adenosylmethionine synthase isoform type-2 [Liparis tanakae]|uniref:S-adenosylmethionine synthase isoform type-2 n=1 Tax=Liparis tanakae TaxID=230148 RepID=A0A4Z2JFU9_9TELE|nr:S-adenosylmethionine synthase isoform type-2 [Liparis tanakae]